MRKKEEIKRDQLTPEQEEFIRLLRQQSENTPIPMSVEPSMMMSRLQPKKRVPWIKIISPVALAVTACFVMVLAGRSGDILNPTLPIASDPASVSESSPQTGPESSSVSSEDTSEETVPPVEDSPTGASQEDVVSSEISSTASTPPPAVDSSVSSEDVASDEQDALPDENGASVPDQDSQGEEIMTEAPQTPPNVYTPGGEGAVVSYLPRDTGSEDYSAVYEAIQAAATPENSNHKYATGVLSAGISTDGLQTSDERAAISAGEGYFYLSQQHEDEVLIIAGNSGRTKTFEVKFETPEFAGLTVEKTAVTGCEVVNGRLFVSGTVSYAQNGKRVRTISALSCYDLQDPVNPALLSTVAQDGTMVGLKAVDGYLYLFSRYYPDSEAPESYPEAYVPFRYLNGSAELVSAEEISISACSDESYIVATAFSSKEPGEVNSSLVLQGGGKNFYLGEEGLYLFGEQNLNGQVTTQISAINYRKGEVTMAGEISVLGILNRSSSPNEYGGTLRVLTNSYGSTNDTNLYIFDRQLNLLGSVKGLVENQILRSVRFEKDTLFFSLYEDRNATYALDLDSPGKLGTPYRAERSEEALQSILLRGDQVLRLTGALGRNSVTLSLNGSDGVETAATIELTGTYNENNIGLESYESGRYVSLTFSDSGSQNQSVLLYAIEGDEMRQILRYECSSWYGGFESYLQDGKFYIVSVAETAVYDVSTGALIRTISY